MSFYVMLEKMPESPDERKQLLEKHFEHETYIDSLQLSYIQKKVIEFLLCSKGYSPENIEVNKVFSVRLKDFDFNASADMILKINDKNIICVKFVTNSIDSWERFAIAFCRAIDSYQIPYALITDGETFRLINILNGSVADGDIELILSRDEAERTIHGGAFQACPEEKKEMEKRIIYAFEGIKCPVKTDL